MMRRGATRRPLPVGQIALFLAIAVACTVYVSVNAVGTDQFAEQHTVTIEMDNAGGLTPRSPVTYRGVEVGTVDAVRVRPAGGGVTVSVSLQAKYQVPVDSAAVVAQDTPVAIRHLDLRPPDDQPPYLTDGAVLPAANTGRPLPLETVLVDLMRLTDSVDMSGVATIADELSTGLAGTAPELRALADNGAELVRRIKSVDPVARRLIDNGLTFLRGVEGSAGRLPQLTSAMRQIAGNLREQTPNALNLARAVPTFTDQLVPLLRENQPGLNVLMANLVTAGQIVAARTPALDRGLVVIPEMFGELASIGNGNIAELSLVATQGGICYYPNERRTPTDTAPRDPKLNLDCGADGPVVRGAANAPRPEPAPPVVTTGDPVTGRVDTGGGPPVSLGGNGGQESLLGDSSWYSIYLQGVR